MRQVHVLKFTSVVLCVALTAGACGDRSADDSASDTGDPAHSLPVQTDTPSQAGVRPTGDQSGDSRTLERLRQEATQLAHTAGCRTAGECATAEMGVKPCGGPWQYLVYCKASTDSAALHRKLDELRTFERAYNERHGLMSDCMMVVEPRPRIEGGACRASEQ